jgi:DNA-directed RNA polymerase subunit E'/Rpb7
METEEEQTAINNIYFNCVLNKKIVIQPKFLNENLDEYIYQYLKKNVEGKCLHEGYVKHESIKIIKKSIGSISGNRFTGDITYNIIFTADLCNPVIGNIIECKVKFINKLGILANNDPIKVIVGKQFHINDNEMNKINENDIIKVQVIAKKFNLNEKEIRVVAKLYSEHQDEAINILPKKEIIMSDLPATINDEFDDEYADLDQLSNQDEEEDNENYEEQDEEFDDLEDEEQDEPEEYDNPIVINNPEKNEMDADDIEIDESDLEEDDAEDEYEEDVDYK